MLRFFCHVFYVLMSSIMDRMHDFGVEINDELHNYLRLPKKKRKNEKFKNVFI